MSEKVFETVNSLEIMKMNLPDSVLTELRGSRPNYRERLERIWTSSSRNGNVSVTGVGGNSDVFVKGLGRLRTRNMNDVRAKHLHFDNDLIRSVAIYPFGIEGLTSDQRPIFQNPDRTTMKSIAIELAENRRSELHWLQRPVEPLFNIDQDGTVLARIHDQPTPAELQLLEDIVGRFEAAC